MRKSAGNTHGHVTRAIFVEIYRENAKRPDRDTKPPGHNCFTKRTLKIKHVPAYTCSLRLDKLLSTREKMIERMRCARLVIKRELPTRAKGWRRELIDEPKGCISILWFLPLVTVSDRLKGSGEWPKDKKATPDPIDDREFQELKESGKDRILDPKKI